MNRINLTPQNFYANYFSHSRSTLICIDTDKVVSLLPKVCSTKCTNLCLSILYIHPPLSHHTFLELVGGGVLLGREERPHQTHVWEPQHRDNLVREKILVFLKESLCLVLHLLEDGNGKRKSLSGFSAGSCINRFSGTNLKSWCFCHCQTKSEGLAAKCLLILNYSQRTSFQGKCPYYITLVTGVISYWNTWAPGRSLYLHEQLSQ